MNFEDFHLDRRIAAGIESAGFDVPTPIQKQAIPEIMEGNDVLGLAQTGTGKTAAFLLPILNRLTQGPLRSVRVLILAPTRELAEQIYQASLVLSKRTKISSMTIYGGVNKKRQVDTLRRGVEIVVACPGRLLDILGDGSIDLSKIEVLVLDEADRMCDMGFLPDIRRILKVLPKKRQTLFFSATMPDDVRNLAKKILIKPKTIQIGIIAPAETVSHAFYPIPQLLKKRFLFAILKQVATGKVLIFTRTKYRARNLARDITKMGFRSIALQGNMSQNQRQRAIDGFRSGKFDILVATDIAARGIDVADIGHVINVDIPDTVDAYTHRIGRTGRAEQLGKAITFVNEEDHGMVREIEKILKMRVPQRKLNDFDYGGFNPDKFFQRTNPKSAHGSHANRNRGKNKRQPRKR